MVRINTPIGVKKEASHVYLRGFATGYNSLINSNYGSAAVSGEVLKGSLEDDVIKKQGTYGTVLLTNSPSFFIEFSVNEDFNLWVTSSGYSDSGGASGAGLSVYKLNSDGSKGDLYTQVTKTQNDSTWYKLFQGKKGSYRIEAMGNYVVFDEMYFESVINNRTLILHDGEYKKLGLGSPEIPSSYYNTVPVMTSNTSPSGIVSANDFNGSDMPYKAFDGVITGSRPYWYAISTRPTGGHWLKYDFGSGKEKKISRITLVTSLVSSGYGLKDFKFFGSNDDVNYVELYSGIHPNLGTKETYNFVNNNTYRYYRINTLSCHDVSNPQHNVIVEMEMMEQTPYKPATPSSWQSISSNLPTTNEFTENGMDSISPLLDRKIIVLEAQSMVQDTTWIENGKVFKKSINSKKYFDIRSINITN